MRNVLKAEMIIDRVALETGGCSDAFCALQHTRHTRHTTHRLQHRVKVARYTGRTIADCLCTVVSSPELTVHQSHGAWMSDVLDVVSGEDWVQGILLFSLVL
jgi:hypothetical protein